MSKSTMITFEEVRVKNELKFKPRPELHNLCLGTLIDVELTYKKTASVKEDGTSSTFEYRDLDVPKLTLVFKQEPTPEDPQERIFRKEENVVVCINNNGVATQKSTVVNLLSQMYARLKHVSDTFAKSPNYVKPKPCPGIDLAADAITRIAQFDAFFKYFKAIFDGKDGKGIYKNTIVKDEVETTVYTKVWLKLVADFSTHTFLSFPTYVGEGFIELFNPKINPSIEIKSNETVTLSAKADKKAGTKTDGGLGYGDGDSSNTDVSDIAAKYM